MAPGSQSKNPHLSDMAVSSLNSDPSSPSTADLSPRIQKLIKDYYDLSWFERFCGFKAPIVWPNVVKFLVLHIFALAGVWYAPYATLMTKLFLIPLYIMSSLGVTAGVHRYWSHKSYKARLPAQIVLMLFNCIAMQNDILDWARDHRVHHKYSETNADPHNAKRGFFFAHMGWLLMKKHPDVLIKGNAIDISDLERDPVVQFHRRYYLPMCLLFSVLLPTVLPHLLWGEDLATAYFLLFAFRYVLSLHSTWLVNSAAHLWGSRRYDRHINPSDNRFVSLAAVGEGWHNYHHTFPYDYAASEWGPRINMTTIVIDCWAALGLVYDRKQVSQESIERVRRRKGDLS